jgi:hypothetical protein
VIYAVTGQTFASWISVTANLSQLGDAIFRLPHRYDTPVLLSLAVLVGLIAVSCFILERRVRGIEVVT